MKNTHKGIWVAYILSCLTPFTFLLSGVVAIVYAGYRLDKNEDGDVINSHYYGLIRTFFLYLTFFVVLIVTAATANGVLIGVHDYWIHSLWLHKIAYVIPYIGMFFALLAIVVWLVRMYQGMQQLRHNLPHKPSTGPNL